MRRVLPVLLLMGCLPTEETFPRQYRERWCEVVDEDCHTVVLDEDCRDLGTPSDDVDPEVVCRFSQTRAQSCLDGPAWSCTLGDAGPQVTAPAVCAKVYTCDAANTVSP